MAHRDLSASADPAAERIDMHATDVENYRDHIASLVTDGYVPNTARPSQITQLYVEHVIDEGETLQLYAGAIIMFNLTKDSDSKLYIWVEEDADGDWISQSFSGIRDLYAYIARFAVRSKAWIYTIERKPWHLLTSCTLDLGSYTAAALERRQ